MDKSLKKKSFVFNIEWQEVLLDYPAEVRLEVYDAIIEYVASGTLLELKPMAKMAFSFIKKEIDFNNQKYADVCAKRSEAGKTGMNNRYQKLTKLTNDNKTNKCYQKLTKLTDNDYENENDNDKDKNIEGDSKGEDKPPVRPSAKKFIPPSVEEVQAYCSTRGNNVNPEQFVSYYTANGWKVGKNPMKDWKAAVRTWENNGYSNNNRDNGRDKNNPLSNQQWRDSGRTKEWDFTDSSDFG